MRTNATAAIIKSTTSTATIEDSTKSIYITINPDEYNPGLERLRRAMRRCKSVDDIDCLDIDDNEDFLVPWYSVADNPATVLAIQSLQKRASKSPMKAGRNRRCDDDGKENSSSGVNEKSKSMRENNKKSDPHAQVKRDFFRLLNIRDPASGCSGFNVSKVNKMLDAVPSLACAKYLFSAFTEPVTALHMLCAMDAPLSCIKRCYTHNRAAMDDTSSVLGAPLHYACYYNANIKIIRYLCHQEMDNNIDAVLCKMNRSKRTPLHLACMNHCDGSDENDNVELVQLLTSACPSAALVIDKDGMTPLHFAVQSETPRLAIIEDLTEVGPDAGLQLSSSTTSTPTTKSKDTEHPNQIQKHQSVQHTPIMMALMNPNTTTEMIQDLMASCPKSLQIVEPTTLNTPLHMAALQQRPISELKRMIQLYPRAMIVNNSKGKSPYKLAKSIQKKIMTNSTTTTAHHHHCTNIVQLFKSITSI